MDAADPSASPLFESTSVPVGAPRASVSTRGKHLGGSWLVVAAALVALTQFTFTMSDTGWQLLSDQQVGLLERSGVRIDDDLVAQIDSSQHKQAYVSAMVASLTFGVGQLLVALVLWSVLRSFGATDLKLRDVLGVVGTTAFILVGAAAFRDGLAYLRGDLRVTTSLALFAPFLEKGTFPAHLLTALDVFGLAWTIALGVRISSLYRKGAIPLILVLSTIYVALAVAQAAIKTLVGAPS